MASLLEAAKAKQARSEYESGYEAGWKGYSTRPGKAKAWERGRRDGIAARGRYWKVREEKMR